MEKIIHIILQSTTATISAVCFLLAIIVMIGSILFQKDEKDKTIASYFFRWILGQFIVLEKEPEPYAEFKFQPKKTTTSTMFCEGCGAPYIRTNKCGHCGREH